MRSAKLPTTSSCDGRAPAWHWPMASCPLLPVHTRHVSSALLELSAPAMRRQRWDSESPGCWMPCGSSSPGVPSLVAGRLHHLATLLRIPAFHPYRCHSEPTALPALTAILFVLRPAKTGLDCPPGSRKLSPHRPTISYDHEYEPVLRLAFSKHFSYYGAITKGP